jgi:MFS transporter, DHA2 family, multidrug resistance protein
MHPELPTGDVLSQVLVGITLSSAGIGTLAYGVWTQAGYQPILLAGLMSMGMGMGCTTLPLSVAAVRALAAHQIARATVLGNVNQRVAGSLGTALMSVILTSQFNRGANIGAANKIAIRQAQASREAPPHLSAIPRKPLVPDFLNPMLCDLSHAYTTVFVVAVVLVVLAYIPAAFLSNKPAATMPGQKPIPLP